MTAISQKYAAFNAKPEPSPLAASAAAAVFTRATVAVFVLIVGIFAGARLWQLAAYSLSSDEVFSLAAARLSWSSLIGFVIEDVVHPPLFYLLLKLWIMIGGESLLWLKLFPALVSIAAIVPFLFLCRELKLGAAEINLALLLMAVNGYMIFYAQDVRMYSLVLFLTLCSLWLFARFYNRADGTRKNLLAVSAINLLLVYTQYYGWLVIGVEGLFLLFWGREKFLPFLTSAAILMLCFSPWVYAAGRAGMRLGLDNSGRTEPVRWTEFVVFYTTLNGSVPHWARAGLLLFAYPLVLWVWHALRRRQGENTEPATALLYWLLLLSFMPVIIAFCAGQVFPKSLASRYLIVVAAPYMIMVAVA
ncbi:MAG: glycosyltransferase family 39 protein, partial [Pyrinomonadaceae bacterium]|nr:glycosyltransferase family 39 protein [Pyrinomonadaceae bacterium]